MTHPEIVARRLHNQLLAGNPAPDPTAALRELAAVQAQDFRGAKWALGMRSEQATEAQVDALFDDGAILRTHVLRPTWHFVLPEDIRWLLALTAPRVHALNATYYRRNGLDAATLARCHGVIARTLEGGQYRTRGELAAALEQAGIESASGSRLGYITMHAELEGLICSGPRHGKQHTYALLDERTPQPADLDRETALVRLTWRFFSSRGPATPHDFSKWSGLTVTDAREGLDALDGPLMQETIGGTAYWFDPDRAAPAEPPPDAHWLPNYDETVSSYADLDNMVAPDAADLLKTNLHRTYPHLMMLRGEIVGLWKRVIETDRLVIEAHPFAPLSEAAKAAFAAAAERYEAFAGMPVVYS